MCYIMPSPLEADLLELAARRKARQDWAYADEMRKLRGDLEPIVTKTIEGFGLENFKKTSMFMSSRKGLDGTAV